MTHETQHNGHAVKIVYDNGATLKHIWIYHDGRLTEIYTQFLNENTCDLFRDHGSMGFLRTGRVMGTASDIYAQICAQYQ